MKKIKNHVSQFLLLTTLASLSWITTACEEANQNESESGLSVGHYFTEAEGEAFLEEVKQKYTTAGEWEQRANRIRTQILKGTGLEVFPEKTPLNPILGEERIYDGYKVQNVAFESLPGVYVTGSLYTPSESDGEGALPGVLSTHGHWTDPGEVGRYRPAAQKRFASIARMGAMVFAYDMVGYGQMEEIGWEHRHPEALKTQLWNSIRATDFLISMGADPDNIASTGASGGGSQTFLHTAIDERISVAAPVVMVSAHFFGGCVCESGMPIHQAEEFQTNNVEIAALAAPRPLLLVSVGGDWTANTPEVEYPHIRYIYKLMGKPEHVENVHLADEDHDYGPNKRAAVYPFLAKHLKLDLSKAMNPDGSLNEEGIVIEEQKTLYPFDDEEPLPAHAIRHNDEVAWTN
ncbi:MAG: hypothetical protein WD510_02710 [Balneolaceae bacterium]